METVLGILFSSPTTAKRRKELNLGFFLVRVFTGGGAVGETRKRTRMAKTNWVPSESEKNDDDDDEESSGADVETVLQQGKR